MMNKIIIDRYDISLYGFFIVALCVEVNMQDISLVILRGLRQLGWYATLPFPCKRIRAIEKDYPNVPDTVYQMLPTAIQGGFSVVQIQRQLVEQGYIGRCMDVFDVQKVLWYLERYKRVLKLQDLTDGDPKEVFVRMAS